MKRNQGRVYIVDDDADSRESVAALAAQLGVSAQSFASAEEFLQDYDGFRPACVVADLRMLGMSGLELQQALHQRGSTVPVVIVTAHADTPTIVQAMQNGAITALDKPCRDSELWNAIRHALDVDLARMDEDFQRQRTATLVGQLSSGEQAVLELLLAGDSNKLIAMKLDLGLRTVEARRQSIMRKLEVDSLAELAAMMTAYQSETRGRHKLESAS